MESLKIGSILHVELDYRITSLLGHGGFGITYLAEATFLYKNIRQTLKFCIKEFFLSDKCSREESGCVKFNADADEENGKKDFKAEAEMLMELKAVPGIVPVSEIIEANNTVYYVMQYLDGDTLDKKIRSDEPMTEKEALSIIEKLDKALSVLHDKKMTHLDVKPENIMLVGEDGSLQPVLIDFGLSRRYIMFGRESSGKKILAISEGYSPVEQYGNIDGFSPESDVYALAATLFHMLTGHQPKASKDVTASYLCSELRQSNVSDKSVNAIVCAMQMEKRYRTESVNKFITDLGLNTTKDRGDEPPKDKGDESTKGTKRINNPPSNPPYSKKKYYLLAAVAALAVMMTLLYFLSGGSDKATLTVKCETPGVDIYINDVKKESSSTSFESRWTGKLAPGHYDVEARKEGYYSQRQSIDLVEKQKDSISLRALLLLGTLVVDYSPNEAEVWIDGIQQGTSPGEFRELALGEHRVEIRKEGYESRVEDVKIEEGQTTSLNGSLKKIPQIFTVNGVKFTMVPVEGGTFTMGATSKQGSVVENDEKPAHKVFLSTYSIGETEVTQELWETVMGKKPSRFKGAKRPVENVSWEDCQEFIRKLNAATRKTFRLPTEAEWEYAARGGNKSRGYMYAGSNDLESVAWYGMNSWDKGEFSPDYGTHNVAQKRSNELGLYDMSGNVCEWCSDWYGYDYYSKSPQTNPQGPDSGQDRVYRGGSWLTITRYCRSSDRCYGAPDAESDFIGLRLVLSE